MSLLYEGRGIVQSYQGVTALSLPEFALREGEVLALTGPNGSGKSTLLRLLAFLETPAEGELVWHGGGAEPRREVTLLLQEPYLLRDNVFRNVTLGLRLRGMTNVRPSYDAAMRAVGFARPQALANRPFHALSGGEKQRVALASRLALRPKVLLLDEPTSNVDACSAKALVVAVRDCMTKGTSVVYATHDHTLLDALGGRELRLGEALSTQEPRQ